MQTEPNDFWRVVVDDNASDNNSAEYADKDLVLINNIKFLTKLATMKYDFNFVVSCRDGHASCDVNGQKSELFPNQSIVCRSGVALTNFMFSPDFDCNIICISNRLLECVLHSQYAIWSNAFYKAPFKVITSQESYINKNKKIVEMISNIDSPLKREIIVSLLRAGFLILCERLIDIDNIDQQTYRHSDVLFNKFLSNISRRQIKKTEIYNYANELCISPKYLSAICLKVSGKTALQWINKFVMDDVKHFLKNTDFSIKEVSERLGFANQSFFGKYVRQHSGMSPAEYRKRLRIENNM